jgi:hypothetical protein
MRLTNKFNLPESIVNAIKNDPYNPGPCDLSVTRLISPPRKVVLEKQHYNEIEEDVSDRIWALFGQAVHTVLERADRNAETETRLSIERQDWVISGQFDQYDPVTGILRDYKVTSCYAVKNGHRKEWEQQMNILATILREHGYTVNALQIVVILRDFSNAAAQRSSDYPECPVVTIDVPLWSQEKCEEFVDSRIRIHQAVQVKLPECTAEERWATPDVWALMKEGRKTAVKIFDSEKEANEALIAASEKHYLDHRPGRNVRCEGYCCCARFCDQCSES